MCGFVFMYVTFIQERVQLKPKTDRGRVREEKERKKERERGRKIER